MARSAHSHKTQWLRLSPQNVSGCLVVTRMAGCLLYFLMFLFSSRSRFLKAFLRLLRLAWRSPSDSLEFSLESLAFSAAR